MVECAQGGIWMRKECIKEIYRGKTEEMCPLWKKEKNEKIV